MIIDPTVIPGLLDDEIGTGSWVLALRLQHEWQPNYWREAAFIPVMRFEVSDAGEVRYSVYDDARGESPSQGAAAPEPRASGVGV